MIVEASEFTRREYAARMNRVVDYIQGHLADSLDLEQLAGVACFSPFHFHRLFRAWTGETLQAFVHRLRLERAAQLLVFNRVRSISDIALECGFSSSSVFARAFKTGFGVSAGEWRKRKICQANRNPWEAGDDVSLGLSRLAGTMVRDKEIPMTKIPLEVQVRRLIPTLRQGRNSVWKSPLVVPTGTAPSGEIGIKRMEGGLYATACVRVLIQDYAAQWDAQVADWLPGSGYQSDHRPGMEFYLNNPETDPQGRYHIEMCLPVLPL
jgi:AraC family transcriptional regulator